MLKRLRKEDYNWYMQLCLEYKIPVEERKLDSISPYQRELPRHFHGEVKYSRQKIRPKKYVK